MGQVVNNRRVFATGMLAGLCGGAAEILWVSAYSSVTGMSSAALAQQVTASVIPAAAGLPAAPLLGIMIHMLLSMALGMAFSWTTWRLFSLRIGTKGIVAIAVVALALVWAVNFFLVLPLLNPAFVTLMPYGATLVSKILFAIAMAGVVRYKGAARLVRSPTTAAGKARSRY